MKRRICLLLGLCILLLCAGCGKKLTAEDARQLLMDTYGTEDAEMGASYDFAYVDEQRIGRNTYYHFLWNVSENSGETAIADLFVEQKTGELTEARYCADGSWAVQCRPAAEEFRSDLTLHQYLGENTQQLYIFSDDGAVSVLSEAGGLRGIFEVYDAEGTLCLDMSIDGQRMVCSCTVWSDGMITLTDQMQFGWTDMLTEADEETVSHFGGDIVG